MPQDRFASMRLHEVLLPRPDGPSRPVGAGAELHPDGARADRDETPPADRSGLDAEQAEAYAAARASQIAALDETRDLVANAASADVEVLEEGMRALNFALIRARKEVSRLRGEKPGGYKELIIELRSTNRRIQRAYDTLLAHHPDPTPEKLGLPEG